MTPHPRATAIGPRIPLFLRGLVRAIVTVGTVVALAGCTLVGAPVPNAPALPAEQFAAAPGRDPNIVNTATSFASDGTTTLAVVEVQGRVTFPQFWWSADAGASWTLAALSTPAAEATQINEAVIGNAAVAVDGDTRTWIALGRTNDDLIVWSSTDARTWQRTIATGIDLRVSTISTIRAVGSGFVAVGSAWDPNGGQRRAYVWQSSDGIAWSGKAVGEEGSELTDVAVRPNAWVAAGHVALTEVNKSGRLVTPTVWTSADSGVSWQARAVPEPKASGDFNASLTSVIATDTGFMVGGSYYHRQGHTYRSWVVHSPDGKSWKLGPSVPISSATSSVDALLWNGQTVRLVQSATRDSDSALEVYTLAKKTWQQLDVPMPDGSMALNDGLAQGAVTLLSVTATTKTADPKLLRQNADEPWTEYRFPDPPGMGAVIKPTMLAKQDGQLTVWGEVQGGFGTWTPGADGSYGPPRIIRDQQQESFSAIRSSPKGLLLLGEQGGEATVLMSKNGADWTESGPGTFNPVAQYHDASVSDAVWAQGRWVVVGDKTTNGSVRRSALIYTSPDGKSWKSASGPHVYQVGDWFNDDVATDLQGLDNRGRAAVGVAKVRNGLLAVGVTQDAAGNHPAYWTSDNGSSWSLKALPSGGLEFAEANHVMALGDRVVVVGNGRPRGGAQWLPQVWTSQDGGDTFTLGQFGAQDKADTLVTAVSAKHGFLVVVNPSGGQSPVLWRCSDALTWTSQPISIPNATVGVEVAVRDMQVEADELILLVSVTNRLDSVTILARHPLA